MKQETKDKLFENEENFKSVPQRLIAPSPPFFKRVIKLGLGIAAFGTTMIPAGVAIPLGDTFQKYWMVGCGLIIVLGSTMAGVAKLAVDWTTVENEPATDNQDDNNDGT